jgi:hypothetical protein
MKKFWKVLLIAIGAVVSLVGYQYVQEVKEQRLADAWEMSERADYQAKRKEYDALDAAFRKECGDFIAIGSLEPARRAAAAGRLEPRHAKGCDDSAKALNARALVLRDAIERGRARERARGVH